MEQLTHASHPDRPGRRRPDWFRLRTAPAASLIWGLVCFVGLQGGLVAALVLWPTVRDPEYGFKSSSLHRQQAAKPGRPLVLVMGSSRVAMGVCPAAISHCRTGDGREPLIFNFSLVGSGPVMQLFCLRRLLAEGIRPEMVFIEYWPPFCYQEGTYAEENRLLVGRLTLADLAVLRRYSAHPRQLYEDWCQFRLTPAFSHRFILLSRYAPGWVPWDRRTDGNWNDLDDFGWLPRNRPANAAVYAEGLKKSKTFYKPIFNDYRLSQVSARALHELLDLCRRERIGTALFFMPEARFFQSWYPPAVRARVDDDFQRLGREYHIPTIDTRDWAADADFIDGFHLHREGAAAFTRRFAREVIQPLLCGRLPDGRLAAGR